VGSSESESSAMMIDIFEQKCQTFDDSRFLQNSKVKTFDAVTCPL